MFGTIIRIIRIVETFPENHDDFEDYARTLKYAYLYAKTVTLGRTHWSDTNRVMLRNRRIGCSVSGVAQFITNRGLDELISNDPPPLFPSMFPKETPFPSSTFFLALALAPSGICL